ncbi:hypothetical protein PQ455_14290 [Sphingomonas naphthae]|uniref:Uncharacterized protein n=1 Tax=Sphingomonas naphthae TaxID=1813468 RepID=A0ABY7THU2_9SPHN|nr:hypothetical protein [Sphingomonas naphthae]WCT72796.1 hypothetical protein PQ455_14290 [Sphingomonas naphthae]
MNAPSLVLRPATAAPLRSPAALHRAHATLARGTAFFAARDWASDGTHARVIGNGLRELDRFLNLLLDEVAALAGAVEDRAGFVRQTNAANKLATLLGPASLHGDRLRAIGRVRAALFHCGGRAHRPGLVADFALALGRAGDGAPFAMLVVAAGDMALICAFYDRITAELLAIVKDGRAVLIDLSAMQP